MIYFIRNILKSFIVKALIGILFFYTILRRRKKERTCPDSFSAAAIRRNPMQAAHSKYYNIYVYRLD